MGFPKPWPTTWPEPGLEPESPEDEPAIDPGEVPIERPEDRIYAVTWAVTHVCNLGCNHCYDVVPDARRSLSTEHATSVIDRLSTAGIDFIAFSGGEPFLRKDILELMAHCRTLDMRIGARSNGTRIDRALAARLADLQTSVVGISFDGACARTHDAVRGPGAFEASLAGVKALAEVGVRTQIEVVLSLSNVNEALDFVRLGEAAGAAEVNFSALTPNGRGATQKNYLLSPELQQEMVAQLREAATQAAVSVTPNCAFEGPCVVNIEPHITCDGWVSPCYLSKTKMFNMLEIAPETFGSRLRATRSQYLDVCGRKAWRPRHKALAVVA